MWVLEQTGLDLYPSSGLPDPSVPPVGQHSDGARTQGHRQMSGQTQVEARRQEQPWHTGREDGVWGDGMGPAQLAVGDAAWVVLRALQTVHTVLPAVFNFLSLGWWCI